MLMINNKTIEISCFPNNENYIDLFISDFENKNIDIFFKYEDDREFFYLRLLKDYIDDNICSPNIKLFMPYVPYSRMDRRESNRLFSLKTVSKMINEMNFNNVIIVEPHSDVTTALFNKITAINLSAKLTIAKMKELIQVKQYETEDILKEAQKEGIYLVFPDAGAAKRYVKQFKNFNNIITCSKHRDFDTGRIDDLHLDFSGNNSLIKKAIIVDDLCSKGGTFYFTAKALKEKLSVPEIYLVVSHCENTIFNGEILYADIIKEIITTDSILSNDRIQEYNNKDIAKCILTVHGFNWGRLPGESFIW